MTPSVRVDRREARRYRLRVDEIAATISDETDRGVEALARERRSTPVVLRDAVDRRERP
jgi:hypothetical protein